MASYRILKNVELSDGTNIVRLPGQVFDESAFQPASGRMVDVYENGRVTGQTPELGEADSLLSTGHIELVTE